MTSSSLTVVILMPNIDALLIPQLLHPPFIEIHNSNTAPDVNFYFSTLCRVEHYIIAPLLIYHLIMTPCCMVLPLDVLREFVWQKQTFLGFVRHIYLCHLVPRVEILFFIIIFLVYIFKYCRSSRRFH